jgi:predicted HTH domain antitoxin
MTRIMKNTIVLPKNLHDEVQVLTRDLGLESTEATVQFLLQKAIEEQRKLRVVRLYQNRRKTMRQCAEMLNVDPEEMIDILRDFRVSFNDDLDQQIQSLENIRKPS